VHEEKGRVESSKQKYIRNTGKQVNNSVRRAVKNCGAIPPIPHMTSWHGA
jgi:hypothetical protein